MKITTRNYSALSFYIHIENDTTEINESIPRSEMEDLSEQLIAAAFEMERFRGGNDLQTVIKIMDAFLNVSEREQLIEHLNPQL